MWCYVVLTLSCNLFPTAWSVLDPISTVQLLFEFALMLNCFSLFLWSCHISPKPKIIVITFQHSICALQNDYFFFKRPVELSKEKLKEGSMSQSLVTLFGILPCYPKLGSRKIGEYRCTWYYSVDIKLHTLFPFVEAEMSSFICNTHGKGGVI